MNLFELFVKIEADDSQFKKSMENAQKVSKNVATAIKNLQSPLDKAKSGFNAIAHPVETAKANIEKLKKVTETIRHPLETFKNKVADASTALETKRNKLSTLTAGYDSAKKKVADITKEFNKSAKESGTSSQKTQELAKKLNEAEKEAEEAKKELDDYSASVSKAGKNSDSASKGVGNFASNLGKGLVTAAKIGTAAVGAAAAGITALTTAAVNNYAVYEQLVGGVETLFKSSSDTVVQYAQNAYKTAGMSANEYMSTVTSFSASLLQSLGGDTEAAAEYANQALTDMSDNANKMGTSMEMIQNAYQGFAKQNYTMLDNLKLGYGGTKEEMQRLIKDAAKLDSSIKANDLSFSNIVKAINVVQTEMGITGTTALEAGRTISGSVGSMKAAWTNLITGLADGNADIGQLVDNLVTTIVGDGTESNLGVLGNVLPAVETALSGATKLVEKLLPQIVKLIPSLIGKNLPNVVKSGVSIVESLIEGLSENQDMILNTVFEIVNILTSGLSELLPRIIELGLNIIISLANGISTSLPTLLPTIISVITKVVETLTNPETLSALLTAALGIITALAEYLLEPNTINTLVDTALSIVKNLVDFIGKNIKPLLDAAIEIIMALVKYLLEPSNIEMLVSTAIEIIVTLAGALVGAVGELVSAVGTLVLEMLNAFGETDWLQIGKDILAGIKEGIENAWESLKEWFSGLFDDLIGIAKKILGIASPSKVFKKLGKWTAEGFGIGFDDEFADVEDDIRNSMDFGDFVVSSGGMRSSSGASGRPINITQNIYAQKKSAAQLMQEARWQAQMGVLAVV